MSTTESAGFAKFALGSALQRGIKSAGFTEPRPIQDQTIDEALAGRDVLGLAQTGTGKTAAFALPILERLLSEKGGRDPRALVVAPTRELANQIDAEIRTLARFTRIRTTTVFGGTSMNKQIRDLRRGTDIVIACPGRLLDLMNQRAVSLANVETLVLDEADHMFDMGFLPDIKRILKALPEDRQNLLFSATMPKEIRGLANALLNDPLVVELANTMPAATIEHALYPVGEVRKLDLLKHLIDQQDFVSAIVFTRTKHRARRLADQLAKSGHKAVALQGNMSQPQRDRAMQGFRRGKSEILVATDIAARGIDVAKVSHVVNYDVPNTPDAYTHRIGRTGRSECEGKAYTFVTGEDRRQVQAIERRIKMQIPRCAVEGFDDPAAHFESRPPSGPRPGGNARRNSRGGRPGDSRGGRNDERRNERDGGKSAKSGKPRNSRAGDDGDRRGGNEKRSAHPGGPGRGPGKRRGPGGNRGGRPGGNRSRRSSRASS